LEAQSTYKAVNIGDVQAPVSGGAGGPLGVSQVRRVSAEPEEPAVLGTAICGAATKMGTTVPPRCSRGAAGQKRCSRSNRSWRHV